MASNLSFQFWEFVDNKEILLSLPLSIIYVTFVLTMRYLDSHKSLSLRPLLFIYNVIATIWSVLTTYLFFMTIYKGWTGSLQKDFLLLGMKIFWLAKVFELMDTFFIVMRKKYDQLSLLHLYHHSSMVILTEWFYKFYPLTHIAFPSFVNSLVHVIMYTYYALNSLNIPCPWKKYLTQLQLFQFAILMIHGVIGGIIYSEWPYWFYVGYEFSMMACFLNFYQRAYGSNKNNNNNKNRSASNGQHRTSETKGTYNEGDINSNHKSKKRMETNPNHKRVKST